MMIKSTYKPYPHGMTGFKIYNMDEVNKNSKNIIQIEPIKEAISTINCADRVKRVINSYLCEVVLDEPHMNEREGR